jgi:hypothetical protein
LGANHLSHREACPPERNRISRILRFGAAIAAEIHGSFVWSPSRSEGLRFLRMTGLVVPGMMKLCFLPADPLLNVRWFGLTLRGVLTCASVGHHAGDP